MEVQLPLSKRRAGLRSGDAEEPPAMEPTAQDGERSEDEGADEAPVDPKFYDTLNKLSGAGLGATSRPDEQQNGSREAEEQLQRELRDLEQEKDLYEFEGSDDDAGDGRGKQPRGVLELEAAGGPQHGRTTRTRGKKSARGKKAKAKAKAKPVRKSRQQRTGSVDLATPEEEQAAVSQTPEERGEGDEDANGEGDKDEDEGDEEESGEKETIPITSDGLRGMVKLMGRRGWTNEGSEYAYELLRQGDESEEEWLDRNGRCLKGGGRCKQLYAEVHHLLKLCQGVPQFPDLDGQIGYLDEQKVAVKKAVNAIQASIDGVVKDIKMVMTKSTRNVDKRWRSAKEAVNSLYLRIIPLLVLCLKQAFLVGTTATMEDDTPEEGQFIACTIQPQLVITRRIAFLYDVLREELENKPPRPVADSREEQETSDPAAKQRAYLGQHLDKFYKRLKQAMAELKRRADAPRLRQQAMENHRRVQAAREERERNVREARDRQMQLFAESTQRMRAAQPRDEYYEKHGWYLAEDEALVKLMKEFASPDAYTLKAAVKGRGLEELVRRVDKLRDSSRRKHEARGVRPPWWCQAPGTTLGCESHS